MKYPTKFFAVIFPQLVGAVLLLFFCFVSSNAFAQWHQTHGQMLMNATRISGPLFFCGEPVWIQNTDVRERLERELLVTLNHADDVILWLKRAHRYFPYLEKVLKIGALPDDLKYIVLVESSLQPLAVSSKGAAGFWQFIEGTARKYNIQINNDVDERRHFFISTDAALKYLQDLYATFGSWTLAAAAYNMGEEGLRTEMLLQNANHYYQLYLNQETQRYIFRIMAAKMILSDPGKYGFYPDEKDLYQPLTYDLVDLNLSESVPIFIVAQAAGTYFKIIKDFNPHIKGYYLSPGKHVLMVPQGAAKEFNNRFEILWSQWNADKEKRFTSCKMVTPFHPLPSASMFPSGRS